MDRLRGVMDRLRGVTDRLRGPMCNYEAAETE